MSNEKDNLAFETEYSTIKTDLERLRTLLNDQITSIINKEKVELGFPIQSRTKNWDSILNKISSGRWSPKKSVTELQDLVGVRIILIFKKDVEKICELIQSQFTVIDSYDTSEKLKENQFGYLSHHFVISVPEEWTKVPTYSGLEKYIAEVQIRTLSQHTWSEASKVLQYKQENSVPRQLLRSISRVSALLETVDLEFERLLNERDIYRESINQKPISSSELLNVDTLEKFLREHLPTENKDKHEAYHEILQELYYFGIKNSKDLGELIKKQLSAALIEDKRMAKDIAAILNEQLRESNTPKEERALKGVFFTSVGLVRTMMGKENYTMYQEAVKARVNNKSK